MPRRDSKDNEAPMLSAIVELELRLEPEQQLFLPLNGSSEGTSETMIVRVKPREQVSAIVTFEIGVGRQGSIMYRYR